MEVRRTNLGIAIQWL